MAGAGSGKTTVMAARVVWLVGTGQVAPEQVLGLTFTNKAAGELAERVRKALVTGRRHRPGRRSTRTTRPGEPRHLHVPRLRRAAPDRPRPAHRPGTHRPAARRRHPLPARRARAARGARPVPGADQVLPDLVSDLLALDARARRAPRTRPRSCARTTPSCCAPWTGAKLTNARPAQGPRGRRRPPRTRRAGRPLPRGQARARPARLRRPDRRCPPSSPAPGPRSGAILRDEFRVVLLDEYQDTSVAQRAAAGRPVRRAAPATP